MRTVTLDELILEVRRRADVEGASDRISDAEITSYINNSIARLYILLDRLDSKYYQTTVDITTTPNTSAYVLPEDFWSLEGCSIQISSSVNIRAREYTPEMGPWLKSTGAWVIGLPIYYRLIGKDPWSGANKDAGVREYIDFAPIPGGTYTMVIDYVKAPQKLYSGSDAFDGQAGFEEWVILDAAIKIKRKNNLDASGLSADKAEMEAFIVSMASNKDQANPETVQDVQNQVYYTWPYGY